MEVQLALGFLLSEKDPAKKFKVFALACRALAPVEQRYIQIERETLGIIWAASFTVTQGLLESILTGRAESDS